MLGTAQNMNFSLNGLADISTNRNNEVSVPIRTYYV